MLAVRLHDDGLKVEEIETPSPDPGDVLVRVHAAAITRGELEWPVDRLPAIPSYELSGVVVGSGDEVKVGAPLVSGAKVKGTVVAHGRADKVKIFKLRRRKHSQKTQGHRQNYTEVRIDDIQG